MRLNISHNKTLVYSECAAGREGGDQNEEEKHHANRI